MTNDENMKELIKHWIKDEVQGCVGEECAKIRREIPRQLDDWHRDAWREIEAQRQEYDDDYDDDDDDIYCPFCSYNRPGVGLVRYGEAGCRHGPS